MSESQTTPRTSIIMPVYNTGQQVVGAIESVLAQTDPDFELLVLIDASPDCASERIADFLAENPDSRVRVFDNSENRGVSAVRNQGLNEARGRWIAFLDSDDRYLPGFLETLHTYAREYGADIAVGRHLLTNSSGQQTVRRRGQAGLYSGADAAQALLKDSLTPYVWDKLFCARLFEGVRFPLDIHRAEDAVVVLSAAVHADFVVVCDVPVYEYTVEVGGLTWGRLTPPSESIRLLEYMEKAVFPALRSTQADQALSTSRVITFLNNAQQALVVGGAEAETVIGQCRDNILWKHIFHTARTAPVFAAAATLLKLSPKLYRVLYGTYVKRTYGI